MRKIVITGWVLGAVLLAACDEKSSGSNATPAQSASANAATVPAATDTAGASSGSAKTEPPKGDTKAKAEGPKDHPARVKALEESFASHEAKKVAALYADDAVVKTAGVPDVKGKEAIEKDAEKMFAVFKDAKLTHGRIWEKDKHVAVFETVFTGVNTGDAPEMGIPKATNKPVGVVGAAWIEVNDDGLIKEEHRYHDMATALGQLMPKKDEKIRSIVSEPPFGTEKYASAEDKGGADNKGPDKGADKGADKEKGKEKAKEEKKEEKGKETKAEEKKAEVKGMDIENMWVAAMNAHKWEEGYKLVAEDIFFVDFTQPADIKGKKAFKDMMGMYITAFPDMAVKMNQSFPDNDFVVAEFEYTGTQKGALGPIKPTNKPVDLHQLEVDQFKDGKFVKGWAWGNNMELLSELGILDKVEKSEKGEKKEDKGGKEPGEHKKEHK